MDPLKDAVRTYAAAHANVDGLAVTPVPGLRTMCLGAPSGDLHSIYRPLVCLVLQGSKLITAGREHRLVSAGQSIVVSAGMPVVGWVVQANRDVPYLAVAIDLRLTILRELAAHLGNAPPPRPVQRRTLFADDTNAAVLDCALRLMRLLDRPEATPLLHQGIIQELHYWLLSGQHGDALRLLADPTGHAGRLGTAIAVLRSAYRSRIQIEQLAATAGMSLSAFHKHFKRMTSLTPGQYHKRLRLIEARRLMREEGLSASSAAFEVGYESISQFTREYGRLFQTPPKRDAIRSRSTSTGQKEQTRRHQAVPAA